MKCFKQKVVVITGAASGMGRAYALAFAKEGSLLALCDFEEKGLQETLELVVNLQKSKNIQAAISSKVFDISNEQEIFEFAFQVKNDLGNAHVVINNAGIEGSTKPVWATDANSFQRVMAVNYFGVVNGTRAFLPQLQENNSGAIVNVSSIFGLAGTPNHADYCGSKFAVRGFTEALMVELASTNIQVHLLHPGGIKTNIARKENSRAFSEHFLTTSADDIAQYLIKSIQQNKLRIVYGNGAMKTFLAARFLPLKWIRSLIWKEMKSTIDCRDY